MPSTIEMTLYHYTELCPDAQERARDWYRTASIDDNYWSEYTIDDAKHIASLIGIEIDKVYWSGFYNQGDGACFTGSYRYVKCAVKAVQGYCNITEIERIAKALQDVQRRHFYKLRATVTHSGRYSHAGGTQIEVFNEDSDFYHSVGGAAEDDITELLRDFMNWIYKQLEAEYDYQNSDDAIEESIIANEYEFTIDGERA